MAARSKGRKVYKTANGKHIDLDLLIQRNELTPAVGNARVNARGDELGPGGKIIRKREEVLKDYYNDTSQGVKDEPVKRKEQPVTGATAAEVAEWEEDEDGNFIKKGEK